jgi:hypothetical protein
MRMGSVTWYNQDDIWWCCKNILYIYNIIGFIFYETIYICVFYIYIYTCWSVDDRAQWTNQQIIGIDGMVTIKDWGVIPI